MSETKSPITLTAGADLGQKLLVKFSGGEAILNTATFSDLPIGVNDYAVADTEVAEVKTLDEGGTLEIMAAVAIAQDDLVYAAAAGKITNVAGGRLIGQALEAASADGSIIEVKSFLDTSMTGGATALTSAAPAIVPGSVNTIDSTAAAVDATLADDTVIGRETYIVMSEASNSSTVSIAHHVTSDPEVATFDAVDETLTLKWNGTEYETIHATATFV